MLTCVDLAAAGITTTSCCVSCHDDDLDGYAPLCELWSSWASAPIGEVCCNVYTEVNADSRQIKDLFFEKILERAMRAAQ